MLCDATQEEGCAGDFHDVAFVLVGMTCVAHLRKRPAGQAAEASRSNQQRRAAATCNIYRLRACKRSGPEGNGGQANH
jgi:hypothetical protein